MTRQAVSSDAAPAALGPYSQAIVAGDFVFCSGMAGIDPATGTIPEGIEAQTDQALVNLAAVLGAAGASMADVVKTTIFYADVEDFARLNEVYARHMPDPAPARSAPAHVRLPQACSSRSRRSPYCRATRTTSRPRPHRGLVVYSPSHQPTGAGYRAEQQRSGRR